MQLFRPFLRAVALFLAVALAFAFSSALEAAAEPRFEHYEIRVIRPRSFVKRQRFELTAGIGSIVNQTFIYSFVATGLFDLPL